MASIYNLMDPTSNSNKAHYFINEKNFRELSNNDNHNNPDEPSSSYRAYYPNSSILLIHNDHNPIIYLTNVDHHAKADTNRNIGTTTYQTTY